MSNDADFDAIALYKAMDAQRIKRELSWRRVADELRQCSASCIVSSVRYPLGSRSGLALPNCITGRSWICHQFALSTSDA